MWRDEFVKVPQITYLFNAKGDIFIEQKKILSIGIFSIVVTNTEFSLVSCTPTKRPMRCVSLGKESLLGEHP